MIVFHLVLVHLLLPLPLSLHLLLPTLAQPVYAQLLQGTNHHLIPPTFSNCSILVVFFFFFCFVFLFAKKVNIDLYRVWFGGFGLFGASREHQRRFVQVSRR